MPEGRTGTGILTPLFELSTPPIKIAPALAYKTFGSIRGHTSICGLLIFTDANRGRGGLVPATHGGI